MSLLDDLVAGRVDRIGSHMFEAQGRRNECASCSLDVASHPIEHPAVTALIVAELDAYEEQAMRDYYEALEGQRVGPAEWRGYSSYDARGGA